MHIYSVRFANLLYHTTATTAIIEQNARSTDRSSCPSFFPIQTRGSRACRSSSKLPGYYGTRKTESLSAAVKYESSIERTTKPEVAYPLLITAKNGIPGLKILEHVTSGQSFLDSYHPLWAKMLPILVERVAKEDPGLLGQSLPGLWLDVGKCARMVES